MQKKEALYAVIGGIFGAILAMAAGSFSPLSAQNESVNSGAITCTGLKVVDSEGIPRVFMSATGIAVLGKDGGKLLMSVGKGKGQVSVYDRDGEGTIMGVTEDGGRFEMVDKEGTPSAWLSTDKHVGGGEFGIFAKNGKRRMTIIVNEKEGSVSIFGEDREGVALVVNEDGGQVGVFGKDGKGTALMNITEFGNGVVMTSDKNGRIDALGK
ncbi:MAG: hypothetical protein OXN17_21460 [Candidatus Poribacteria bacterium]|nr:hypothetical protein [Candidatus Poribacteria bacterium]MDE0502691.1 hypothetical protein [Candidatus Poribacteria bacterium]